MPSYSQVMQQQQFVSASAADEAADTAEKLKQQVTLGRQCQEAIFKRVSVLKKKTFLGSQVPFPELPTSFEPDVLLRRMPPGSVLKLDKFNGRWEASWKAPTGSFKRLTRSRGLRGHKQCIIEVMDWVWAWPLAMECSAHTSGHYNLQQPSPRLVVVMQLVLQLVQLQLQKLSPRRGQKR